MWEIVHCTLVHYTLYNVTLWSPVGGVHIDALHIVQFTLYLQIYLHHVPLCTCAPVHLCTVPVPDLRYMYLTPGTSLQVPHSKYLQHLSACRYLDNMCIHRVTVLHRVTIVLAGALQVGPQLPSTLAFLLAGGQLSHTLCTTVHCTLYTVHGVTSSSRYVQEVSLL